MNHTESGTEYRDICIPFGLVEMDSRRNEVYAHLRRWFSSRNIQVMDKNGVDRLLRLLERTDEDSMKQQRNMIALLSTDHTGTVTADVMTFEQALEILPQQWSKSSTSYIFYRDDPGCIDGNCVFLQRVQLTKNCFIHAAAMLQYCLMSRSKRNAQTGAIIDIKVFIRDISRSLEPYIFDKGGKISEVFNEIVLGDPKFHWTEFKDIDAQWLKNYGPGVLTFGVRNETLVFGSNESLIYRGIPTGEIGSFHSVLIIGVRMERDSRLFLIQNWWPEQQVVEIREDYAIASNGKAFFIKDQDLIVREGLPWTKQKYGEI